MLAICETKDDRLVRAYNEGRLEIFIVGMINNIWGKRGRFKQHEDGSTSPLMVYSNTYNIESEERKQINQMSLDYNHKADSIWDATKTILKNECESNDMKIRYPARVYNYSNNNIAGLNIKAFSNARQFAESSGIPYSAVWKTCNEYKKDLKDKLKNIIND